MNNKQTFTFTSYLVALHETWCVKDFPFLKYNLIYLSPLGQFCSILTAILTVWPCIELTGQKTFPSFSLYWLLQSAMASLQTLVIKILSHKNKFYLELSFCNFVTKHTKIPPDKIHSPFHYLGADTVYSKWQRCQRPK